MYEKDIHYNIEMERATLGICMLEQTAFGRTYGLITDKNLYHEGHRLVYRTMKSMYEGGQPIDVLTVGDQLIRRQGLRQISGNNTSYFLSEMTHIVTQSAHVEYWCYVLKTMWMEREIMRLTQSGTAGMSGDAFQKVAQLQLALSELNKSAASYDWNDMSSLMVQLYQHQDKMQQTGGMGILTGFKTIDNKNGGFHPGQMVVIAARPSVGKSAIAGQIAINMARNRVKVGIVSLEMSNVEIAARLAAIDTDTNFEVLFRGLYQDEEQSRRVYKRIGDSTSGLPIYVTDKTDVNIFDIRAKAEKLKSREGINVLIIDYLQLVDTDGTPDRNREQAVAALSRGCKIMAKEMNICVIVVAQLNREVTKRGKSDRGKGNPEERFPILSDLRESGAIEQDADAVMFLHRDWMSGTQTLTDGSSTEKDAQLVIRKWRNGAANLVVDLDFDGPKMMFKERSSWMKVPDIRQQVSAQPFSNINISDVDFEEDPF